MRTQADVALAADALRGTGLAGDQVGRADGNRPRGAMRSVDRALHAFLHRAHIAGVVGDAHAGRLWQRLPAFLESMAHRPRKMQLLPQSTVGQSRRALRELHRRDQPVALADAGVDGVAEKPFLLEAFTLPRR